MSTLQGLARRRRAVMSTERVMSAMKLMAGTRLRKLEASLEAAKKEARAFRRLVAGVRLMPADVTLPFYAQDKGKKPVWVVLGGDKGLCGSFHFQIFKAVQQALTVTKTQPVLYVVGTRTARMLRRLEAPVIDVQVWGRTSAEGMAAQVLTFLETEAKAEGLTGARVFATRFKNAFSQNVQHETLVCLMKDLWCAQSAAVKHAPKGGRTAEELDQAFVEVGRPAEPSATVFLQHAVRFYLYAILYQACVETRLCEESIRMSAMDNAARNSEELLEAINLRYNQTRQMMITRELIEVVSGANAL